MSTFCVIRNKAFKDQAKRVNVSEDALERIWHKFINEKGDPNITPTDEDIQKEYEGYHVESSKNYNIVHTLWESSYSNPIIFDTLDEAQNKKAELATLFKESAIVIKPLNNNTFEVKVAEPTLAGTVVKSKNDIFEGIKPEIQAEMEEIKQKAIADGTFMKAPNGKPTKLNERQWLQVRTKEFKEWFGDWEKVISNVKLEETSHIGTGRTHFYEYKINDSEGYLSTAVDTKNKTITISGIEATKGKGLGVNSYVALQNKFPGYTINSDKEALSKDAERMWDRMVNNGIAIKHSYKNYTLVLPNVSKVVDENGEPLVVYHGSNYENDSTTKGDWSKNTLPYATYFAPYKYGNANQYYSAFLNIKNPLASLIDLTEDAIQDKDIFNREIVDKGYDGAISVSNKINKVSLEAYNAKEIIVTNPNQIKSATNNNGEFSDVDNNIYRNIKRRTPIVLDSSKEGKRLKSLIRKAIEGSEENSGTLKNPIFPKERTTITFDELTKIILSRNPEYKDLLQLFKEANPNLNIVIGGESEIIDENGEVYIQHGVFEPSYNTLYLSHAADIQTAIHELAHAATVYGMARYADNKISFRRKIDQFVDYVKDYINENSESVDKNLTDLIYGFTDSYEFVAEIFSNPSFRDLLEEIPPMEEKKFKSLFGQLWSAILDFLNDIFGGNKLSKNALEQAKKLSFSAVKLQQQRLDIIDKTLQSNLKQYASHSELKRIVYNKEQEAAINAAVEHIQNVMQGKSDMPFYTIQGKAGTGKTTIVNEILKRANVAGSYSFYRPTVLMGALSLKATAVLEGKITPEMKNQYNFEYKSIAGMLNKRKDDDGNYVTIKGKENEDRPVDKASIIIVDEASMVNEEDLYELADAVEGKHKPIIFLGDIGQLPPIRTTDFFDNLDIPDEEVSPIFTRDDIPSSKLLIRVRQGESSPVLDYADKYWLYGQELSDKYPIDLKERSKVSDSGALIMQREEIKLEEQLLPLFKEAKEAGNPNLIKIVAFRNETVDKYNRAIRKSLYPDIEGDGFQKGDLIIFNSTYGRKGEIPNSWESSVISVKKASVDINSFVKRRGLENYIELEDVEIEYIKVKGPNNTIFEVPAIVNTPENLEAHERNKRALYKLPKDIWKGKVGNRSMYGNAKALRDSYENEYTAQVGYAYAITSHKSQGSTYDVVAVDAADINSVTKTSLKTKSRSIYTGLTRASNITIVSSSTTNENIVYTDIKGLNDRINAVKRGENTEENYTPKTEENPYFAEVTEDDLGKAIYGLKKSKKKSKHDTKEDTLDDLSDIDDPRYYSELPTVEEGELKSWGALGKKKSKKAEKDEEDSEEEPTEEVKRNQEREERRKKIKRIKEKRKIKEEEEIEEELEDKASDKYEENEDDSPQDAAFKAFVKSQRELGKNITFNAKTHKYKVYGERAKFSVTEFRDFILGKEFNNSLWDVAGYLGTSHDSVLRDYFDPDKDLASKYPNFTSAQITNFRHQAYKLKLDLIKRFTVNGIKPIFITDESLLRVAANIKYEGKEYLIAGTMDMVVIDGRGNIHIIDFKTKRANNSKDLSDEKISAYELQTYIYKGCLTTEKSIRDKVKKTKIAQFNIEYPDPREYEYSYNGDQVYVEYKGEDVPIQKLEKLYSTGKLYAVLNMSYDNDDLVFSKVKGVDEKRKEVKEESENNSIEVNHFRAQMNKWFSGNAREGVKSKSTLYAIKEKNDDGTRVRTATTRYTKDGHMPYLKKIKKGDIVTFYDRSGNEVKVRCTVPFHKLDKNTDVEEWSRKEGWSKKYFKKEVLPEIKGDGAWQMEYELLEDSEDKEGVRIEINSKSKKYALLSNFGDKEFDIEDSGGHIKTFPTVEHYFHWVKAFVAEDKRMAAKIKNAVSPNQAQYYGKYKLEMTKKQIKRWDSMSRNVMKKGMRAAFEQNDDARELLLSTGKALLTHFYNEKTGESQGPFADILMELREEFGGYGKPETPEQAVKRAKEVSKKAKQAPIANDQEDIEEQEDITDNIIESKGGYGERTDENADWSDATIAIAEDFTTPGEIRTKRAAGKKYIKAKIDTELDLEDQADEIADSLYKNLKKKKQTKDINLNIAGNGIYTLQEDQEYYDKLIERVLKNLLDKGITIKEVRSGGQSGIDEAGVKAAAKLGLKWSINAPKNYAWRDEKNQNFYGKDKFIERFESILNKDNSNVEKNEETHNSAKNKEWTQRGNKQLKISTQGYRKGDPQANKDTAFIFTENAEAYTYVHDIDLDIDLNFPYDKEPKINVSDVKGTNQAGIRTDSEGNISENAFGVVVKKYQQNKDGKFVAQEGTFKDNDDDFTLFQVLNEDMFNKLEESGLKKIVFPSQMAMGKSALPKRFADWLANELYNRYGIISTVTKREKNDKGYEGYGLVINSIESEEDDNNLHVEEKDKRYSPQTTSEIDAFNTAAQELRRNGWHVEFYKKKSKDGSIVNNVMTISLKSNPNKGFFELVKDVEENNYSVHFKTKSKKALNETPFADESLEDEEKENLFRALIFAIPEGGVVSTWGKLSKGGINALNNLGDRSESVLTKIGERTLEDQLIPVYKKLSEEELAEKFVSDIQVKNRKEKNIQESFIEEDEYYKMDRADVDSYPYKGVYMLTLNEPNGDSIIRPNVTDGSKDDVLKKLIQSRPFSSIITLDRRNINANYLYTLNTLLQNDLLYPVWGDTTVTLDPKSVEGIFAKEYAKTNKAFRYDSKTGVLHIPRFTIGYTNTEIQRRAASNRLIHNSIGMTQSEIRELAKASIYKMSHYITQIQSHKDAYKELFGEESKEDFTQLSRIEIIEKIGLQKLMSLVKERIFNTNIPKPDLSRSTKKKMNLIYDNWIAFEQLGYDTLIRVEEISFSDKDKKNVKSDLDSIIGEEDEISIQEEFGSSIEHWQVGFRQVSAISSLSGLIKNVIDSLYEIDENGYIIYNEYGLEKHLNPQVIAAKILYYTRGCTSLDAIDSNGDLSEYSMLYKLKEAVENEPWLEQIVYLLEDQYDDDGNITHKADEQFKSQFYTNFRKYFQKYAISFKPKEGPIRVKIINEHEYADNLLKACQAKENSFALGGFKLKTKDGKLNQKVFNELVSLHTKLEGYVNQIKTEKGKLTDVLDLDKYHKDLKAAIDYLDIDISDTDMLYKNFSTKKTLEYFTDRLENIIDAINGGDLDITSNGDYKKIVRIIAKGEDKEMESVSYEAGKLYYSYVLPSYLNRLVDKLTGEYMSESEYDDFLEDEYLRYKWFKKGRKIRCHWLDRLKKDKNVRENFQHVTSLSFLGKEYSEKSPVEYIASMMKMYFYDKGKKWAYFRVPTLSNKPSEEYLKFERIHRNFKEVILDHMWQVFLQELDRIQAVRERNNNIEDYQKITSKGKSVTFDKRGLQFVIEDYLQPYLDGTYVENYDLDSKDPKVIKEAEEAEEFHELLNLKLDGKIKENSNQSARLITLFEKISQKEIEKKYEEAKQQWIDEGFITINKKGKISKVFKNMKLSEKDLEEFFWNDTFAAINILELTITDPAYYKDAEDLQKRLAQLHAPGKQANIWAKDRNGNYYTNPENAKERTIYIKDDIVKSSAYANLEQAVKQIIDTTPKERKGFVAKQLNNILKAFKEINFADAQGYSCPSSYRKKMGVFGDWTDAMEDAYLKLIHPEQYPDVDMSELLDVLWQPLKPFVYSQIAKPGHNSILPELKVSVQNKNSEFVLVIADALMRRTGIPNKLKAIYDFMEASQHNENGELNGEGIDTVQFMSAVNAGCLGVIDLNDEVDENGNVTHYKTEEEIKKELSKVYTVENGEIIYDQDYVHEIPFEDYIIQQNVPHHYASHEQPQGSQNRVLIFADMPNVDPITGEDNYLKIDGKLVTVKEAKENYFNAIAENIEESKQKLISRFKLDSADERVKNIAISKVLKEAILKDSRFGADLLWACDTDEDGNFNIPLSDPIQSNRIQQLLNSVIKNTINKQEIAGGPVVQVSSWGTSDKLNIRWQTKTGEILLTESEFNNDIYPDDYNEEINGKRVWKSKDGYMNYEKYIADQAGVAYFEVFIPVQDAQIAKDFTKKDDKGNEYVDIKAVEEACPELLEMVGYRIPTESKYSMAPIKIKGFLTRTSGEGIMLPADITTLAGSDFDIDKLYMMYYSFRRKEKDGKVTYEKETEGRKGRNNLILSTELAVLRSEQVRQQLFTPGNFDEPKKYGYLISYVQAEAERTGKSAKKIYEEAKDWDIDTLKDKNKKAKNLIYNNVQVQFHKQNMVAGKLIGIFAQANVSHAFVSLGENPTIFISDLQSFTLGDKKKLSGETRIDTIYTRDNSTYISNNLAAFLAASVDAVKDPILNLVNINSDTANVVIALLRLGYDVETVSLLCSQPAIRNLITDYNLKNSTKFTSMSSVISEHITKLTENNPNLEKIKNIILAKENMISNLDGKSAVNNYMALRIFERCLEIADTFSDITHMTRYNSITSAVGPFASDTMLLRIKDKKFKSNEAIYSSVREACNNPVLKAFRESSEEIERLILGANLIQAGDEFDKALNKLSTVLGYSRGVSSKIANAFSDFYMSYYVNAGMEGTVFDLSYKNRIDMLTKFPKIFQVLKKKYKDNAFINSILYVENDAEEYPFLQLKTRGLSSEAIEDLKKAWETLYDNEDSKKLAIRLVEYCFFRGSFGFNPKTFMNLVPNIIKDGLNNYIDVLNDRSSIVELGIKTDDIIYQFILHNTKYINSIYENLENYNPQHLDHSTYGDCLLLNRKSTDKDDAFISDSPNPFIKIDDKYYFVVRDFNLTKSNIQDMEDEFEDFESAKYEYILLKEVDPLGGNNEGFEISTTESFPKTIYKGIKETENEDSEESEPEREDDENNNDNDKPVNTKKTLNKEAAGVLLDQLFADDDKLKKVVNMYAGYALTEMNKALSSRENIQFSGSVQNKKVMKALLDSLKGVSDINKIRKILNEGERTASEVLNLCK